MKIDIIGRQVFCDGDLVAELARNGANSRLFEQFLSDVAVSPAPTLQSVKDDALHLTVEEMQDLSNYIQQLLQGE